MPYISEQEQSAVQHITDQIDRAMIAHPGVLNFLVTCLAIRYMEMRENRYEYMSAVTGALDDAKDEFRRRIMHPYEKQKAFNADMIGKDPYTKIV